MKPYKRLLLKLSGEQLSGDFDGGIDPKLIGWIAKEIKSATDAGVQVAVMIGGGNYLRGAQFAGKGVHRVNADYMGMLATMMNALALNDIFQKSGLPARALSNISAPQIMDDFSPRRALDDMNKGRTVVIAGGIGRPFLTTDTAAVSMALELECDVILKATKVDGVYDKDPSKFDNAKHIAEMAFSQAVEDPNVKVMDKAALGLAMDQHIPIIVFDLLVEGNIAKAARGEAIGTLIH